MKKLHWLTVFAIILFFWFGVVEFVSAQQYLNRNATWEQNLTGSEYFNTIVFADIDNDNDMDMIQFGCGEGDLGRCDESDPTKIFVNNGTTLNENQTWQQNLSGGGDDSAAFGDIDNDGDLDLILVGGTIVYINNGTTFIENSSWHNEIQEQESGTESVTLGDIDNDGDLDLVFVDIGQISNSTFLNNGTSFVASPTWGQETRFDYRVSSALVDFDNDGDLDSLSIGYDYGSVYENNGTTLALSSTWGAYSEDHVSIAVGDLDNDGDMDYIQMGERDKQAWINNGTTLIPDDSWNPTLRLFYGSLSLGDYDNNGYLDLASIGNLAGAKYNIVYNNTGTLFSWSNEDNLIVIQSDSVVWVDIDNDNDLDLYSGTIYINNITTPNTAPNSPVSLSSSYSNREIKLGWLNGSDAETSVNGLYYNLMVGTSTTNHTIISGIYGGQGDVSGGGGIAFGYFGNMMQRKNLSLKVNRLSPNTEYTWFVQTIDTGLKAGEWSAVQSFTTPNDMTDPTITLNTPVEYYNSSSYSITFNATISDANITNVSLWGNWTGNGWHLNDSNSSGFNDTEYIFIKDLTDEGDGMYLWKIEALDNETNTVNSSIRTLVMDSVVPDINVTSPANDTNLSDNEVDIEYVVSDTNLDVCWYSNDTMSENISLSCGTNITTITWTEGEHNVTIWANDSAGNENLSMVFFIIDSANPNVNITSPENNTYQSNNTIQINYTVSDANLDVCWYSNDTYSENTSVSCGTNITGITWTEGEHNVTIWANDSAGNVNWSMINFTIDSTNPTISISSPVNNTYQTDNSLDIEYEYTEVNPDSCWYSNDTMSANTSLASCGTNITDVTWSEGEHNVTIWIKDSVGNEVLDYVNFTVDSLNPNVNITYPVNDTNYAINTVSVNYTVSDTNLQSCWYSNDTYLENITWSCGTNLTNVTWTEGQHNVTIWANDSSNNVNSSEITFRIDTLIPDLNITSPANNSNSTDTGLDIEYVVSDTYLKECWYSNDTYSVNTSVSCGTNVTDITWSEGEHNITIWANDTINNENSSMVFFTIDSLKPDVNITSPLNHINSTNNSLYIEYVVSDTNLQSCWYSNDSYSENITWSCGSNLTNVTWADGKHNLTIWANDSFGNVNSSDVNFTIDTGYPIVNLISPADGSTWSSSSTVTFSYNVSDVDIANCSLIIGNVLDQTDHSITEDTTQTFTKTMGNANYNWYVNCSDYVGYTNGSTQRSLTISYSSGDDGSPGGGGGSSGGTPVITAPVEKEFDVDFSTSTKASFSVSQGDIKTFSFNNKTKHTITVLALTSNSMTLLITSEPITIQVNVNGIKRIDMNKDGIDDLEFKLISIVNGKASFEINKLSGALIAGQEELEQAVLKEALFDVKVSVLEKFREVFAGEEVSAEIEVLNVNNIGQVDVVVDYYLSDNEIVYGSGGSDTLAVEAVASFVRSLLVPEDITPGIYYFNVNVSYKDFVTSGSGEFRVKGELSFLEDGFKLIVILTMIFLVIIIAVIFFYLRRRQKKDITNIKRQMSKLKNKSRRKKK